MAQATTGLALGGLTSQATDRWTDAEDSEEDPEEDQGQLAAEEAANAETAAFVVP